ncbi:PD-(D/E)XK nuclease family protein [Natronobacterium texcoconense]|uniref:PD-(D/E)XK nuclease superfamily protein n=1 Tax=Natronobacterium texcoconense TaxID=1095778 RepID=A0A1H1AGC5_NATTX|nr:PD-(D/E)XK nuclease family protein [Natronobacterium texcoconense]SDQ38591.1 PD-(D/E)XK nuclease superfamily protein [Natronobacterium texcoconense]
MTDGSDALSVEALRSYLHCPRQYEFAHVHDLEGTGEDDATDDRVSLLRTAICAALETGETDRETLETVAKRRLTALWNDHDEPFHSQVQRRHERRVLEATLRAYLERAGVEHATGIEQLRRDVDGNAEPLVGPEIELSSTVSVVDSDDTVDEDVETESVTLEASVDYVYGDGSSLVGVRFVPTLWPMGYLRYRSEWEDVEDQFIDHFDPEADAFDPDPAGTLLETAVALDGLRSYADRLGLSDRTCRYVWIPLADRSETSVNWVRETVETDLEVADLTDVYVDHHTFGMTHEHRNRTVDGRLESVVDRIESNGFDPGEQWDDVVDDVCPDCEYRVCCGEYVGTEVTFDG